MWPENMVDSSYCHNKVKSTSSCFSVSEEVGGVNSLLLLAPSSAWRCWPGADVYPRRLLYPCCASSSVDREMSRMHNECGPTEIFKLWIRCADPGHCVFNSCPSRVAVKYHYLSTTLTRLASDRWYIRKRWTVLLRQELQDLQSCSAQDPPENWCQTQSYW